MRFLLVLILGVVLGLSVGSASGWEADINSGGNDNELFGKNGADRRRICACGQERRAMAKGKI